MLYRTRVILFTIAVTATAMALAPTAARAADCYRSTIVAPSPFMGNNDEVFKLADGTLWQVKYEYEYLYEYQPEVVICPSSGLLSIDGKTLKVAAVRSGRSPPSTGRRSNVPANALTVVFRLSGCDYFVADGPQGYYLLEWYSGHDPDVGDALVGYERGYVFKNVIYVQSGSTGRVWVEDYLLSRNSAAEKITEKCH